MSRRGTVRKAVIASWVAVMLLTPISVIVSAGIWAECKVTNCEPFAADQTRDLLEREKDAAVAAGMADQIMYTTEIGDENEPLPQAVKRYVYCREGPADADIGICDGPPTADEIKEAIRTFKPIRSGCSNLNERGCGNVRTCQYVSSSGEVAQGCWRQDALIPHEVEVNWGDGTVISARTGEISGRTSTFVYDVPMPGGHHAEVRINIGTGSLTTGVIR